MTEQGEEMPLWERVLLSNDPLVAELYFALTKVERERDELKLSGCEYQTSVGEKCCLDKGHLREVPGHPGEFHMVLLEGS